MGKFDGKVVIVTGKHAPSGRSVPLAEVKRVYSFSVANGGPSLPYWF